MTLKAGGDQPSQVTLGRDLGYKCVFLGATHKPTRRSPHGKLGGGVALLLHSLLADCSLSSGGLPQLLAQTLHLTPSLDLLAFLSVPQGVQIALSIHGLKILMAS